MSDQYAAEVAATIQAAIAEYYSEANRCKEAAAAILAEWESHDWHRLEIHGVISAAQADYMAACDDDAAASASLHRVAPLTD